MKLCFLMQGREQEVTLTDLHHIAEEEQKAWFDEADSRQVGGCSASHHSACVTAHVHSCVLRCVHMMFTQAKKTSHLMSTSAVSLYHIMTFENCWSNAVTLKHRAQHLHMPKAHLLLQLQQSAALHDLTFWCACCCSTLRA